MAYKDDSIIKPISTFQKSISFKSLSQHSSKKADNSHEVVEKSRSISPPATDRLSQQAPTEELPDGPKIPSDDKLQDLSNTSATTLPDVTSEDKDQSGAAFTDVGLTNDKQVNIRDDNAPIDKEVLNENQISDMISIDDDKKSLLLSEITEKGDTLSHVESQGS